MGILGAIDGHQKWISIYPSNVINVRLLATEFLRLYITNVDTYGNFYDGENAPKLPCTKLRWKILAYIFTHFS